ncbi:hypothetical protein [Kitasatospora sp. NPDC088134]|uniref:hypothetical protein n=1 Tax=Kitasatospora sp. NPDC088134 TaxID=3364071 RepID=UPI00381E72F0
MVTDAAAPGPAGVDGDRAGGVLRTAGRARPEVHLTDRRTGGAGSAGGRGADGLLVAGWSLGLGPVLALADQGAGRAATGRRAAEVRYAARRLTARLVGSAGTAPRAVRPAGPRAAGRPGPSTARAAAATRPLAAPSTAALRPAGSLGPVVDCLVTRHPRLPRDRMGNRVNGAGRWLIAEAVGRLYGVRLTPRELGRDEHRRWSVPQLGLTASVAHCAEYSTVVLASSGRAVGVDLQDHRDRPAAMRWLGELLGRPDGEPATMRDFAECEALIKASHLRKETFAGVRLPAWAPGWRPTNVGYLVRSADLGGGLQLALAIDAPAPVRWWWQPDQAGPAVRTDALTLEPAA